jgi:hypothetical protein
MRDMVIGLPLRVGRDGQLARSTPHDALVRLFGAMAATSRTAWPHAPWFGLAEVLAEANVQLEDHPALADALNAALAGLGVTWTRVERVHTAPAAHGQRAFHIVLVSAEGQAVHAELAA